MAVGTFLQQWGPTIVNAASSLLDRNASRDAQDEQTDALDEAGRLQYETALQALEMARLRDIQTRLDTRPTRFQGFNAMQQIARQLGLPVYNGRFDETLAAFSPGGRGGVGGGDGSTGRDAFPGGRATFSSRTAGDRAAGEHEQIAGIAGTALGSYFGGPVGGAIGGYLGSMAGERTGREIERRGWLMGPIAAGAKFAWDPTGLVNKVFGDGGDQLTGSRVYANMVGDNAVFFDQDGNVVWRGKRPSEGMVQVEGVSRNENQVFLTSDGRLVKRQQSGGGFDDLGFDINTATDGPIEVNKVVANGYTPLPSRASDFAGGIAGDYIVDSGEYGGSQFIPADGGTALDRYAGFRETPGYQFVLDEGMNAIDKRAASRGRYFSGGTQREGQRYAAGLASQEYDNYFRRLQDQVTGGNSATQFTSTLGAGQTGNAINALIGGASDLGDTILAGGQVRASGIRSGQESLNRTIEGIAGSGIFDRLGTIFGGGKSTGPATISKPTSGSSLVYRDPFRQEATDYFAQYGR